MIPIILKLRKAGHKEVAKAQDVIVEELYKEFSNAVIHGGTAIWRCYSGNRFSEDVDAYLPKDNEKINNFFKSLEKKGFVVEKKKISENSIYSNLKYNRTYVRFEATFQKKQSVLKEYETVDGNFITIYTLSPEALIKEKSSAYMKRLKIRDLYDVFFLLRCVKDKESVKTAVRMLVKEFKPAEDMQDLKVLVLEGIVPTQGKMIEYIKNWAG